MNPHDPQHLTADELDSFLTPTSSPDALSHVATCASCAALVASDRRLLDALAALPVFEPSPGFTDRVMVRARAEVVAQSAPTGRAVAARRRAIGMGALAGTGLAAAFAWAAVHPAAAFHWAGPAVDQLGHSLWLAWQSVAADVTGQAWFATARSTFANPARVVATVAGVALAYTVTLTGLRRLMTEPVAHASW